MYKHNHATNTRCLVFKKREFTHGQTNFGVTNKFCKQEYWFLPETFVERKVYISGAWINGSTLFRKHDKGRKERDSSDFNSTESKLANKWDKWWVHPPLKYCTSIWLALHQHTEALALLTFWRVSTTALTKMRYLRKGWSLRLRNPPFTLESPRTNRSGMFCRTNAAAT